MILSSHINRAVHLTVGFIVILFCLNMMLLKSDLEVKTIGMTAYSDPGEAEAYSGNVYYVDSSLGDDVNSGMSVDYAWKTIAKVNAAALQPGDFVLFKRGGIWREQLNISSSGTSDAYITYADYGEGAKPLITGADIVTGWNQYAGNVYVADVSNAAAFSQLYVDGKYYDIAHYPDSGFLITSANSLDNHSLIDSDLELSAEQIIGADVMVKFHPWYMTHANALSFDDISKTINLDRSIYYNSNMSAGYGYYLQNKSWMLDSEKEWYYNPAEGKIYLWLEGNENPNTPTVEVASRKYGIYGEGIEYVAVNGLAVSKAERDNVFFRNCTGITISGLNVSGGSNGIVLYNVTSASVTDNTIQDTLVDGIDAITAVNHLEIKDNRIDNAGNIGMPRRSHASINVGTGSSINAESVNISNNVINHSGYIGIMFYGNLINVENNTIDNSCLVLDDCGGIYTSSYQNTGGTIVTNNSIVGNTVRNTLGNCQGSIYGILYNCYTISQGIYLDAATYTTQVINNTIYNADYGIFSNDGYNNTFSGNKVFLSRLHPLGLVSGSFSGSISLGGLTRNNTITGNIFESNRTSAVIYLQNNANDSVLDYGSFDNNLFCHPNTQNAVTTIVNKAPSDPQRVLTYSYYKLADWQLLSQQDLHSVNVSSYCHNNSALVDAWERGCEGMFCGTATNPYSIVPLPQNITFLGDEAISLKSGWSIVADLSDEHENFTAWYLRDKILSNSSGEISPGLLDISSEIPDSSIIIGNPNTNLFVREQAQAEGIDLNSELTKGYNQGYILSIKPGKILILANSTAGTFYGAISLSWLLDYVSETGTFYLPNAMITDWPDMAIRGFYGYGTLVVDGQTISSSSNLTFFADYLTRYKYNLLTTLPGILFNTSSAGTIQTYLERKDFAEKRHFYTVATFAPNSIIYLDRSYYEGAYAENISMRFNESDIAEPVPENYEGFFNNSGFEEDIDGNGIPDGWHVTSTTTPNDLSDDWFLDCSVSHSGSCSIKLNQTRDNTGTILSTEYLRAPSLPSIVFDKLKPGKMYMITLWAKLDGTVNYEQRRPQLTVMLDDSTHPEYSQSSFIEIADEWVKQYLIFSTYNNETKVRFYSRAQGTAPLNLWIDDLEFIDLNSKLYNVLRTPDTRLHLYNKDKTLEYSEGIDYELIETGTIQPHDITNGKKTTIHRLEGGSIPSEAEVLVDYDYSVSLDYNNGWVTFSDDSFHDTYEHYIINATMHYLKPDFAFVNLDEIRGFNRDSRSIRKGLENYQLYAEFANAFMDSIKKYDPDIRVITWDDMHIPFQNGQAENYQVRYGGKYGRTWHALDLLDRNYENIAWWYEDNDFFTKMANVPNLFETYGFKWYGGPFDNPINTKRWSYLSYTHGAAGIFGHSFYNRFDGIPLVANYSWNAVKELSQECDSQYLEMCDGIDNDCDNLYSVSSYSTLVWPSNIDEGFYLNNDTFNCGECGVICYYSKAYGSCNDSQCQFDGCYEGYHDANGNHVDGCECILTHDGVEIEDDTDNDCDGTIDEGFTGMTASSGGVPAGRGGGGNLNFPIKEQPAPSTSQKKNLTQEPMPAANISQDSGADMLSPPHELPEESHISANQPQGQIFTWLTELSFAAPSIIAVIFVTSLLFILIVHATRKAHHNQLLNKYIEHHLEKGYTLEEIEKAINDRLQKDKYTKEDREHLEAYIKNCLAGHYPKDAIIQACDTVGWDEELTKDIMEEIGMEGRK